ncbi:MAG TPA: FecR domain-containing protein [Steroidobacteraceae bacterium]|nr:FecR domain-containing protein [Steroidobacteraceae bacterium]
MSARSGARDMRTVRAEAAAWLARLRSEERTADDEKGFRAWLAENEAHRAAFDVTNSVFEMAGAARRVARTPAPRVTRRHVLRTGIGLAAASVAGVAIYLRSGTTYATEIGELRDVSLEDGTRVRLDTDSEIRVSMSEELRRVQLRRGRAHFDVAADSTRPFQVLALDQLVTASRGAFDISRDGVLLSVLPQAQPVHIVNENAGVATPRMIMPGQLVVFAGDRLVREEQPEMKRAIAWRFGRLALFEERLADAVAQMNRYTPRPIVILDPEIAQLRVSGNYSVGDAQAFATSISVLLPVEVGLERDRITLRAASGGKQRTI